MDVQNNKKRGRPKTYLSEESKIMSVRVNSRTYYSNHGDKKRKSRNRLYYMQKLNKAIENDDFKTIMKINDSKIDNEWNFWIFPMLP